MQVGMYKIGMGGHSVPLYKGNICCQLNLVDVGTLYYVLSVSSGILKRSWIHNTIQNCSIVKTFLVKTNLKVGIGLSAATISQFKLSKYCGDSVYKLGLLWSVWWSISSLRRPFPPVYHGNYCLYNWVFIFFQLFMFFVLSYIFKPGYKLLKVKKSNLNSHFLHSSLRLCYVE